MVLSWNNFCYQGSLIICPLVLSAIYPYNPDAIYYFSSIFSAIGLLVMISLACRKDSKTLGKKSLVEKQELPVKEVELEDKSAIGNNCEASIDQEKDVDITPTNKLSTVEVSVVSTEVLAPATEVPIPVTEGSNTAITATPNPVTVDPSVVSL